jgi:tetratricopeptide (TPR) repeat protein
MNFKTKAAGLLLAAMLFSPLGLAAKNATLDFAEAAFDRGEQLYQEGKYGEAIQAYQEVITKYPLSRLAPRSQFRIAESLWREGKDREAIEQFSLFIKNSRVDVDVSRAYEYLAEIREAGFRRDLEASRSRVWQAEQDASRVKESCKYLRSSVESEEPYLELDISHNRLNIKIGTRTLYSYPIVSGQGKKILLATGEQVDFSTPRGIVEVLSKEKDPVWYRPDWFWLEHGEQPPPDLTAEERAVPGYLGKYRINLGGGIYIHGTQSGTISPGKFSHGCIRMNAPDLEKVWEMTKTGTKVFIY